MSIIEECVCVCVCVFVCLQCLKMISGGGKSDMDRVGVFKEMSYISVGDKYSPTHCKYYIYLFICLITSQKLCFVVCVTFSIEDD